VYIYIYIYILQKKGTGLSRSGGRTAGKIFFSRKEGKSNFKSQQGHDEKKKEVSGREIGEREGAYAQ
jgi:hypothetical protein